MLFQKQLRREAAGNEDGIPHIELRPVPLCQLPVFVRRLVLFRAGQGCIDRYHDVVQREGEGSRNRLLYRVQGFTGMAEDEKAFRANAFPAATTYHLFRFRDRDVLPDEAQNVRATRFDPEGNVPAALLLHESDDFGIDCIYPAHAGPGKADAPVIQNIEKIEDAPGSDCEGVIHKSDFPDMMPMVEDLDFGGDILGASLPQGVAKG